MLKFVFLTTLLFGLQTFAASWWNGTYECTNFEVLNEFGFGTPVKLVVQLTDVDQELEIKMSVSMDDQTTGSSQYNLRDIKQTERPGSVVISSAARILSPIDTEVNGKRVLTILHNVDKKKKIVFEEKGLWFSRMIFICEI